MNFKEWSDKYYPGETDEVLHKMSRAWASASLKEVDESSKTEYKYCPECGKKL